MPHLIPFVERILGLPFDTSTRRPEITPPVHRYGNIEDIVIEATLVTPAGIVETRRPAARTSTGMQPLALLFGSEGNLGVITRALIAIHPKPEECRYGSLVFHRFADGVAFLKTVRVTQTYHAGVCVYFTLALYGRGPADPGAVFHDVEQALRQVVLDHGGSLSHHHGVGKIRQRFLPQVHSAAGLEAIRAAKRGVDPRNIFGIRNGACGR
jgi:FAD/FMN-containing dehydrogenase